MRLRSSLVAALVLGASVASASDAEPPPPPPTVVAFDPSIMPEPPGPTAPLGYRYASLSASQAKHLRRGFKLPMEALSSGRSLAAIQRSVVVAPLPDPEQPFLAVKPALGGSNPFTGSRTTSFREDPMRAFGELLGAVEGDAAYADAAAGGASDDPFGESSGGGFATEVTPEVTDEPAATSDPFEDASDPFGGDDSDDPFADF